MKHESQGDRLQTLARHLADWRRSHRPPAAIPDEIWSQAAGLAAERGINIVAQALGLGHAPLKRRVEQRETTVQIASATFLELVGTSRASTNSCVVEVHRADGRGHLSFRLDSASTGDLVAMVRGFLE